MVAALQPAPKDFLKALRARSHSLGITTADKYLREFEQCLDGACPSNILGNVTEAQWQRAMKRASQTAVYQGPGFNLGEFSTVKEGSIPSGLELPPKTIAIVNTIVTTPTQDRDGDILETLGAHVFPRSTHLFNHLPTENIGRFLKETAHTKELLSALLSLHSTQLAENVAIMYEHGSLETSHGFLPRKWEPLKDGGFRIEEFDIVEISGVSVPSNPDAGPIEFSRNKLTHPLLKQWGQWKFRNRQKMATVGIDLSALPPGTTITLGPVETHKPSSTDKSTCSCQSHKGLPDMPVKEVLPFHDAPVSKSDTWDADSAVKGVREWAGVNENEPSDSAWTKYAEAFALREGEKNTFTSYKLPYKQVEDGKLVINPKGVSSGIGALNGGRGGDMDISEEDKKGAYGVLVKAYKKAYPDQDPPELKTIEPQTKGVYVEFENSWDDIRDDLQDTLLGHMIVSGEAEANDWAYIVDMFPDRAIVCVCDGMGSSFWGPCGPYDDDRMNYFSLTWAMGADGEPAWTGKPQPIEITPEIKPAAERAIAVLRIKGMMKPSHLKSLQSASDRLQKAHDHEDAKAGPKLHIKRAKAHIEGVMAAHEDGEDEKGFVTDAHRGRLEKAAAYCQKALDHADCAEGMKTHIKAAKDKIEGVMEAHEPEEDKDEKQLRLEKEGRAVSAANEKKLRAAQTHLKAVGEDEDAHAEVRQNANDGAESIDQIFAIGQGGDAGQDYDQDGNYVGTDVGAYTDGEPNKSLKALLTVSGELPDNVKAALSKARMAMAKKALGHAQAIVDHDEAGEDHKGHAMVAKSKLKSVIGKEAEGPAMGTDPSTPEPGQPEEKSLGDRANELAEDFAFATAEGDEQKLFDIIESAGSVASLVKSVRDAQLEVDLSLAETQLDRDLDAAEVAGAEAIINV